MKKIAFVLAVALIGITSCKKEDSVKPSKTGRTMIDTGKTNMGDWD